MKKIKFRCWDKKLERWEYWELPQDAGYMAGRFNKQNVTKKGNRFSTSTLGQFTGLLDKNGKEIYEGDIVKLYSIEGNYEIIFENAGFYAKNEQETLGIGVWYKEEKIEVINNIYEKSLVVAPD